MKAVYMTDQGKVRLHNEDSGGIFKNLEGKRLTVVADGMGGHRAGDVASGMTIDELKNQWESTIGIQTAEQAENWLQDHILQVNRMLFEHAKK